MPPVDPGRPLRIGFSPCPNDCAAFHALVAGAVDTPLRFTAVLDDVQALNAMAADGALDVVKVSYHAAARLAHRYRLLPSGGALGRGVGPLLVAREPLTSVRGLEVAIPGADTTAALLLALYAPGTRTRTMRFDAIMPAVASGEQGAGLVIHEGRFTYTEHGLVCVQDLGAWWERVSGTLVPLGAVAVARSLDEGVQREVAAAVHASVRAALHDPSASEAYVAEHAAELEPWVRRRHVELYVNEWTLHLGAEGRAAVDALFETAAARGLLEAPPADLFVDWSPQPTA